MARWQSRGASACYCAPCHDAYFLVCILPCCVLVSVNLAMMHTLQTDLCLRHLHTVSPSHDLMKDDPAADHS